MNKRIYGFSFLSAIFYILASPPVEFEILGFFVLTPLFISIKESKTLKQAFRVGMAGGLLTTIGLYYWLIYTMTTFGGLSYPLSVALFFLLGAYLSLYWGLFTLTVKYLTVSGLSMLITAPAIWVALEYLRTYLFSGFPWALLGYTQYKNTYFIQVADITGVYGVSFILVLTSAIIFKGSRTFFSKGKIPFREALFLSVIIVATFFYGFIRSDTDTKNIDQTKVAVIQGNINQQVKWDRDYLEKTLSIYDSLSSEAVKENSDINLIVWPETAAPFYFQQRSTQRLRVENISKSLNKPILFGSPAFKKENNKYQLFNSAYLISPQENGKKVDVIGRYDKIHLVPFGEYVPLKKLLFFVSKITEGIGDFTPGQDFKALQLSNKSNPSSPFALGSLICYEVIFPNLVRQFVNEGANLLVNITNDGWYGKTSAPYQHLSAAVFRAVENKVYLLRAANTGISAIISPTGEIENSLGIFKRGFVAGKVDLNEEKTFYSKNGDLFSIVTSLAVIIMIIYVYMRKRIDS